MLDLLITGGTVVDGSGAPMRTADVGVRDGRIAVVAPTGTIDEPGGATLEADGRYVTPGFVDLHTHLREPGYEEKETILVPGESVLFYTDGLVEAHNPQGEMFGNPRLRGLLSEHPMGVADLSATLLEELGRFTGEGWEQEDDITLLTLERSTTQS